MRKIFFAFLILFQQELLAQQDSLVWKEVWSIPTTNITAWDIDEQENCILAKGNLLQKLNKEGQLTFQQSSKAIGKIASIDARNPMKILLFSEEQQLIHFCDNSLTAQQDNIDLSIFNLNNITKISGSSQPNKCWVYNQDNSQLALLSQNNSQLQRIENCKGLLGFNEVNQLLEVNSQLFLIDYNKGIYQLDMYGSLIQFLAIPPFTYCWIENNLIYTLTGNEMRITPLANEQNHKIIKLPFTVLELKKQGNFYYLLGKEKLSKLSLSK